MSYEEAFNWVVENAPQEVIDVLADREIYTTNQIKQYKSSLATLAEQAFILHQRLQDK